MILAIALLLGFQSADDLVFRHVEKRAPLKCGEYQHVYHWPGPCGPQECSPEGGCFAICMPPPPDRCEDNILQITERDWVNLMKRLKTLEDKAK